MFKTRDSIYPSFEVRVTLRRIKIAIFALMVSFAIFILGTSVVSWAFESAASVTLSAQYIVPYDDYEGGEVPDSWYLSYGLDPTNPDVGDYDGDNDGITNREEYRMRTDPTKSDSGIVAALTATPSSGLQPLDIIFTAGSNGGTYPIVRYEWDFDGNGTYDVWCYASEGNTATYKYTADGNYNVKLRVTDSMGNAGIATATVNVARNEALSPPTATPELNFATISIPKTQQLNAIASDNEGVTRYQWDTTGNGEYDISLTKSGSVTKTYNQTVTRSYNAHFKVTDTDGLSDIATVGIMTDATKWNDSPYRPRVYLNEYIVYGTAGVPVSLGGYGMPQMGNAYGYAKKLEWDFEGDGIYDRSSTIDNDDWTGRADVTHTYGAPGIYRAVLKAHTEAELSATDSVLVIISANATPPTAKATVSYRGVKDVTEIDDTIPINARFEHSLSSGSIVKYEWDFDGDKKIDYATASSKKRPVYHYRLPGYYVASLKITDTSGLIDTFYIPVFAYYPEGYSTQISSPSEGLTIAGNAITVTCDVSPDDAGVNSVMFQYRKEDDPIWSDIGLGAPILSYITAWDTTGLEDGVVYQLRAIVNGEDSDLFNIASVVVDNLTPTPDIYENKYGNTHQKEVKVLSDESNLIVLPDGTSIDIPQGAIDSDSKVIIKQTIGAGIGEIKLEIIGIEEFLKDITISITYPDADNNGIVDGTNINENTLVVAWLDEDGKWEKAYDSVVYPDENIVSAKTNHLSLWGLISTAGGVAGGISSAMVSSSTTLSYCFIATSAYGTPMAEDVITLRAFRDRYLMQNGLGRRFVRYYYRYSPPIAKFIEDKPALRAIARFLLKPLVKIADLTVGGRPLGRE